MKPGLIVCLLLCFTQLLSCKKDEMKLDHELKIINFNSDKIISSVYDKFICIDYIKGSMICVDKGGKVLWSKTELFTSKDSEKKSDEKPQIKSLADGSVMIWEQIEDTFIVANAQFYTQWIITKIDQSGELIFHKKIKTIDGKKVLPLNFVELSNHDIIALGIVETNKISGAISIVKIDKDGNIKWNKTINPAGYWLNGIFPNDKTSIHMAVSADKVLAIIQIGTQTSCFIFDLEGNVQLYKKENYATEDNIQRQIDAKTYWEYPITEIQNINDNEFLIYGVKYSGADYTPSNNKYFKDIFTYKINSNFEISMQKDYPLSNIVSSVIALQNGSLITLASNERDVLGNDNIMSIKTVNSNNLELTDNYSLTQLINYQSMAVIVYGNNVILSGINSAFESNNKNTFILNVNKNESL